jgi:hypothetical protein
VASKISDIWVHTTVLIENDWGERGTGFFVSAPLPYDEGQSRVFIVTNKHVLNKDPKLRDQAEWVNLGLNVKSNGETMGKHLQYPVKYDNGRPAWHGHPDADVDVLAIDATYLVHQVAGLSFMHAVYSAFANAEVMKRSRITFGDEIVVVGYPLGLKQGLTNYPLVRQGMLATSPEQNLYDESTGQTLRGFLIDGATVPGSSGSPVLLKPTVKIDPDEGLTETASWLLGIVAETRYSPTRTPTGHVTSYTGLGLAFHADTIKETIEPMLSW